ncbi:hypothetical protein B0H14DRAFT_3511952 [Mycena olivaceomarginata]|nr:hypothetical protein B0H14DRAFT_3511952 [Mycena olivaceomarginata]
MPRVLMTAFSSSPLSAFLRHPIASVSLDPNSISSSAFALLTLFADALATIRFRSPLKLLQSCAVLFGCSTAYPAHRQARLGPAPSAYTASPYSASPNAYGGTYSDDERERASSEGVSAMASLRQIGEPLTLTPEDIRHRMSLQHGNGRESWRQSADEVFGALSIMRTGGPTAPDANTADNEDDDTGEYLFAPQQAETVFQYLGTPAGERVQQPRHPRLALRHAHAASDHVPRRHAPRLRRSTPSSTPGPLACAEVVALIKDSGMRVLYKPEDESSAAVGARTASPALIRAGPGARVSR